MNLNHERTYIDGRCCGHTAQIERQPHILQFSPKCYQSLFIRLIQFVEIQTGGEDLFVGLLNDRNCIKRIHLTIGKLTEVSMRPRLLLLSTCLIDSWKSLSSSKLKLLTGGLFIVTVAIPVLSSTSTRVRLLTLEERNLPKSGSLNWRLPRSKSLVWLRSILETVDHMIQPIKGRLSLIYTS